MEKEVQIFNNLLSLFQNMVSVYESEKLPESPFLGEGKEEMNLNHFLSQLFSDRFEIYEKSDNDNILYRSLQEISNESKGGKKIFFPPRSKLFDLLDNKLRAASEEFRKKTSSTVSSFSSSSSKVDPLSTKKGKGISKKSSKKKTVQAKYERKMKSFAQSFSPSSKKNFSGLGYQDFMQDFNKPMTKEEKREVADLKAFMEIMKEAPLLETETKNEEEEQLSPSKEENVVEL